MRTIPYINKTTTANTQYRQTSPLDTKWVLDQCKRIVEVAEVLEQHGINNPINHPSPRLPKQSSGKRNTPKTMCEGVIENFDKGQYDLSNKQCDGLEEAFRIGEQELEGIEEVVFEEVASLPKIKTTPARVPVDSVFSALFNVDEYEVDTITLRRKAK